MERFAAGIPSYPNCYFRSYAACPLITIHPQQSSRLSIQGLNRFAVTSSPSYVKTFLVSRTALPLTQPEPAFPSRSLLG
jgi:hypothetical protein